MDGACESDVVKCGSCHWADLEFEPKSLDRACRAQYNFTRCINFAQYRDLKRLVARKVPAWNSCCTADHVGLGRWIETVRGVNSHLQSLYDAPHCLPAPANATAELLPLRRRQAWESGLTCAACATVIFSLSALQVRGPVAAPHHMR